MRATDPYAVLGLTADATEDEVKRAYRNLSRRYHPDTADTADGDNTEAFIRITRAYHAIIAGEGAIEDVAPAAPAAPTPPFRKKRRRLFIPRLSLRAVVGLALLAVIAVAACLVVSEVYTRRVMLRALHDGGVAFVPPPTHRRAQDEPAALTFAEKLRRERLAEKLRQERLAEIAAASKENIAQSSRPTPAASTQPTPAAAQPSSAQSSRPTPAVISTAGRDPVQQSSAAGKNNPSHDNTRFLASLRNDREGASSQPNPTTSSQPSPAQSSRPTPAVISTAGRDPVQQSTTAKNNPSQVNTRFLASLRNDSGGSLTSAALPGTSGFISSAQNDSAEASSRPTPAVISTAGRDPVQQSTTAKNNPSQVNTRFLASQRNDSGGSLTTAALPATPRILPNAQNDSADTKAGTPAKKVKPTAEPPKTQAAGTPKPEPPKRQESAPSAAATPAVAATKPVIPPAQAAQSAPTVVAAKPAVAAQVPSAPAPAQPTNAQLQQRLDHFLAAYCQAYGARDLNAFKRYFTANATENGTQITDLLPTYSKLFASTEKLALRISTLRWHEAKQGQIAVNGRFTIDLDYRESGPVHGSGKIDFQLAYDDTTFHIQKMKYSFDR